MRELTFTGFLAKYVRSLSLANSGSLYKLSAESAHGNPRLREPLLLYALFTGKDAVLLRAAKDAALHESYMAVLSLYDKDGMLKALRTGAKNLPEEYKKVWNSYLSQKSRPQTDCETKELMRKRVLKLQAAAGVTNYRLYADLGLNPGNLNAWLKHGDSGKVSMDTARKTLQYLEQHPGQCR